MPIFKSLVWLNPEKSQRKWDSNLGSCALKVDTLTTRPTRPSMLGDSYPGKQWAGWRLSLNYTMSLDRQMDKWQCSEPHVQLPRELDLRPHLWTGQQKFAMIALQKFAMITLQKFAMITLQQAVLGQLLPAVNVLPLHGLGQLRQLEPALDHFNPLGFLYLAEQLTAAFRLFCFPTVYIFNKQFGSHIWLCMWSPKWLFAPNKCNHITTSFNMTIQGTAALRVTCRCEVIHFTYQLNSQTMITESQKTISAYCRPRSLHIKGLHQFITLCSRSRSHQITGQRQFTTLSTRSWSHQLTGQDQFTATLGHFSSRFYVHSSLYTESPIKTQVEINAPTLLVTWIYRSKSACHSSW